MAEWDKLWEERKSHYYNLNTNTADFIHCVKIEGDRLKEKAEKWEKLVAFKKSGDSVSLVEEVQDTRRKIEGLRELAPKILSWMLEGVRYALEYSSPGVDKKMQAEHDELKRQFTELLGIKEGS